MNGLDWVIVAVLVISVAVAAAEGFFVELFSLAGVVLGFVLAAWQYGSLAPWFAPHVKSPAVASAAGFLVIFFSVAVVFAAAGKMARWAFQKVGLRWMDRLLGSAFGLVRGVIVATAMVVALAAFVPESQLFRGSELSRYLLLAGHLAKWTAPAEVRERFQQGIASLRAERRESGSGADRTAASGEKPPAGIVKQ